MEGNSFTIAIQTGTGILVFADYGDNETLEMLWISDKDHIPAITVPYDEIGQYNATFWARSASSTAITSTKAFVDDEIHSNASVTKLELELYKDLNTTFVIEISNGTNFDVYVDPGYNTTSTQQFYAKSPPNAIKISQDYRFPGTFQASVLVNNSVSQVPWTFTVLVGIKWNSNMLYTAVTPLLTGSTGTLNLTLPAVDINCAFNFGNGFYYVYTSMIVLSPVIVHPNYTEPGNYTTKVLCQNAYHQEENTAFVVVMDQISNLHFLVEDDVAHLEATGELELPFAIDNGSLVEYVGRRGSSVVGDISLTDDRSGTWKLSASQLTGEDYDDIEMTLYAVNALSSDKANITILVDKALTGCRLNYDEFCTVNVSYNLIFTCDTGTRVSYWIDTGDGAGLVLVKTETTLSSAVTYAKTWTTVGCLTFSYSINNSVSSFDGQDQVCIENPLPPADDILVTYKNITDVGEVTFTFELDVGGKMPTNVKADWNYDDEYTNTEWVHFTNDNGKAVMSSLHQFQFEKVFNVSCRLFNNVSSVALNLYVRVGTPITGLKLDPERGQAIVGEPFKFTIHIDNGSSVTFTFASGSEENRTYTRDVRPSSDPYDLDIEFTYSQPTPHVRPSIRAENVFGSVGWVYTKTELEVGYRVPLLKLSTLSGSLYEPNGTITFVVSQKLDSSPMAMLPVKCEWSSDFLSAPVKTIIDKDMTAFRAETTGTVSEVGDHAITVNCSNSGSWNSTSLDFYTRVPVSGLQVIVNDSMVNIPMTVAARLEAGSHVLYSLDFGDGSPLDKGILAENNELQVTHTYQTINEYQVNVTVRNEISSVWQAAQVSVSSLLQPDLNLETNSPVEYVDGQPPPTVNFRIPIDPEWRVSRKCEVTVNYDNGLGLQTAEHSLLDDITWSYDYTAPGSYDVKISVKAIGDERTLDALVKVVIRLTEITITVAPPGEESSAKNEFPAGTPLLFVAEHDKGTGAEYSWNITDSDGQVIHSETTTTNELLYTVTTEGNYLVHVTADNGIGDGDPGFPRQAMAEFSMSETGIILKMVYDTQAVVGQYKFYSVLLSSRYQQYFATMCIKFSFGDQIFWIAPMLRYCLNVDPDVDELAYQVQPPNELQSIRHKFDEKGTKFIEAKAMIETGKAFSMRGKVEVTGFCFRPIVTRLDIYKEMSYRRQDKINIPGKAFDVKVNCSEGGVNMTYVLLKAHGEDYSSALRVVGKDVSIPAFTLDYGLYNLSYEVTMQSKPDLRGSAQLKLEIMPSAIEVSFDDGIYQMASLNEKVRVSVSVNNPDYPGKRDSAVHLYWYCYQEGEAELDSPPMVDFPTNNSQLHLGLGGCFNGGPGQLNVDPTQYNITLDTTFMLSGKAYVITVRATRNSEPIGTIQKTVEIFKGKILPVVIRCTGNCGDKVNRDVGVFLDALCEECTPDSVFEWSTSSGISLDDAENRELHIGSEKLVEGQVIAIQVKVRSKIGEGKAIYEFGVNYAPRPGYCTSDISEGDISSTFKLSCHDWQDDGWNKIDGTGFHVQESAVLTYSYAYFDKFGTIHSLAGNNVQLPSGDPDNDYIVPMKGYVTDQYGATSETSFTVKVKPVDNPYFLEDMTAQLEGGDMSTTIVNLESHLDTLNVVATEVLGLLNVDGSDDEETESNSLVEAPASSPEEEKAKEQDSARLKLLDKAVDLFANIITSDVELSPVQTASLASSLSSVKLPKTALPNTMNTMLNSAGSLAESLSSQMSGEDQSPAQIEVITKSVASIADNVVKAAKDKLLQPEISQDLIDQAAADIPMTEEEEKRLRKKMKQREEELNELKRKILTSTIMISQQIGVGMSHNDLPVTTIQTDSMSIKRKLIDQRVNLGPPSVTVVDAKNTSSKASFNSSDLGNGDMAIQMTAFDRAIFGVSKDSNIGEAVIMAKIFQSDKSDPDSTTTMSLTQEQMAPDEIPKNKSTESNQDTDTGMVYFALTVNGSAAFSMNLEPEDITDDVTIDVFVKINCTNVIECRPDHNDYDFMTKLPKKSQASPWLVVLNNVGGDLYVGIDAKAISKRKRRAADVGNSTYVPPLTISAGVSSCNMYDDENKIWSDGNGTLSDDSTVGSPTCLFPPTSGTKAYSSGFTVPTVNPINFNRIFADFASLLGDNNAVFITVFVMFGVYLVLAVFARRFDRKDVEKWGVLPLCDNPRNGSHFYKISVYTGLRTGAGTKSNITFILTGDDADTGMRMLRDKKSREFSRGSIRHFLLSTRYSLGGLTFLRIWHDNSGKGDSASWFFDKMVVEDFQTGSKYYFLCNQWLAVDEGDGQINRVVPVAGRDEITGFGHLFFDNTRKRLFDDHLWLSVIGRPSRSNFTRLQRLSCIICVLYLTMVTNAMWYGRAYVEHDRIIKVGPLTLSGATLLVSLFGSLTVIPVNTLILMLFRKHRPKDWPTDEQLITRLGSGAPVPAHLQEASDKRKKKWWKAKYPLPYWCAYIAWALLIAVTLTSMLFIIFYSQEWGRKKSEEWLSTLVLSIVESVLFFQPLKVIFFSMVIALIFKTIEEDDDVCERQNNAKPSPDEQIIEESLEELREVTMRPPPEILDEDRLAEARKKREREKKMWAAVKDSVFYFLFLVLLCFIVWGSKDELAYTNNRMILTHLAGGSIETFEQTVTNGHAFWDWTKRVLVERLFYTTHYNGQPGTPRERNFLSDGVNYRVGPLVMRQVRVKPSGANVPVNIRTSIKDGGLYNLIDEENRDFTPNWELDTNETDAELSRIQEAFRYRSFSELKGIPYVGKLATYGGGGYVANLGSSRGQALELINQLIEYSWLDRYTRAIFVEFTAYNPNTNYFTHITYIMESPAIGALLPQSRIQSFQLYIRLSGMNLVLIACEIIYMILIVYFMAHEVMEFRRSRGTYWKDVWKYIEVAVIVLSWAALAMYVMKEIIGRLVLSDLAKDKDKYMNFKLFAYYEEIQWYVVGFIVFMADIKFLRILRYNNQVMHFARTLHHAAGGLLSFGVMFSVLFMAFTSSGYLLFSKHMTDFRTVISVMESLYSMLIGKFDVRQMEQTDRILGPLYFALFMVIIYIVIVNIFLGIIDNAYTEVTRMACFTCEDFRIMNMFAEKLNQYFHLKKDEKEAEYLDNYDSLEKRLESLDRMVTAECRAILNLDSDLEATIQNHSGSKKPVMKQKIRKLAILTKQLHHGNP